MEMFNLGKFIFYVLYSIRNELSADKTGLGKCNFSSKLQRTLRKVRQNYNDLVFKEKQVKNNKNA